jgi:hypothetical protein
VVWRLTRRLARSGVQYTVRMFAEEAIKDETECVRLHFQSVDRELLTVRVHNMMREVCKGGLLERERERRKG